MNVAIIGASGYTGLELIKILINHPKFNITYIANSSGEMNVQDLHPCLKNVLNIDVSLADASEVAKVLRGKNKPVYTPHVDTGDYVIIVNADKVKVTGKKMDQKIYYHHSDYVGGMKETTLKEMMAKKPEKVVELAVKGMLPKGPLGRQMFTKLHVYAGAEHAHAAQKPEVLTF